VIYRYNITILFINWKRMLHLSLDAHPAYATNEVANFRQHTLFTTRLSNLDLPSHQSNFALITTLYGSMSVKINGIINEISHEHFIVVNRGSSISIAVDQQCQPFLLYFINGAGDDWNPDRGRSELRCRPPGSASSLSWSRSTW